MAASRFYAMGLCCWTTLCFGADPKLPGPALSLPVDLDRDGQSTFGDLYAFNYWLEQGGSLADALASARVEGALVDLSDFFAGPKSALSADAPQASLPEGGLAGPQGILGPTGCQTTGQLSPTFRSQQTGTFVCAAFVDDASLNVDQADGHALDEAANRLYVGRSVAGANAGVTRIFLGNLLQNGLIPLSASQATKITQGTAFCQASHLAFRASDNHLFVALETRDGIDCAGIDGVVKNLTLDANGDVVDITNVFTPGTIIAGRQVIFCEGLALVPSIACAPANPARLFGNPGELFIGEDVNSGDNLGGSRFLKFGAQTSAICPVPPPASTLFAIVPADQSIDKLEGFALGNFNGAGLFGLFAAVQDLDIVALTVATNPMSFSLRGVPFADNNTLTSPAPPSLPVNMDRPDSIAFDPISGNLFVSEDSEGPQAGAIWIIVPNGTAEEASRKLVFASGFTPLRGVQGMSFPDSGVMLVSESGTQGQQDSLITVIDGWRFKFNRGDANSDGKVDLSDPVFIHNHLFQGGAEPTCFDAADANDDALTDMSDVILLYNFLYQGGAPPAPPFFGTNLSDTEAACASASPTLVTRDPTIDLMGCRQYLGGCRITF